MGLWVERNDEGCMIESWIRRGKKAAAWLHSDVPATIIIFLIWNKHVIQHVTSLNFVSSRLPLPPRVLGDQVSSSPSKVLFESFKSTSFLFAPNPK